MSRIVLPGSTIGILGSGQLGRMFTLAARRLGYRVHVFSGDSDSPTGQVADREIRASYEDLDALEAFARGVDVVTFEFENVPVSSIHAMERRVPVYPRAEVLHTTQHRLREKSFLRATGIPTTPFAAIHQASDLKSIDASLFPAVLKTAAWGYDGKGQCKVASAAELENAWAQLQCQEAILEKFVEFSREFSVIAARGHDGSIAIFEPIANTHRNHILDISVSPGQFNDRIVKEATEIASLIVNQLQVVGVLCVEFFLTNQEEVLVNELAPRPHNSGHLTIDAYESCQFEQQVRAVCGLPLARIQPLSPSAMVNLLGDLWSHGPPEWARALAMPGVKLHLYGKLEPRAGRKMGHLTALANSGEHAAEQALAARAALLQHPPPGGQARIKP
jgi:5-(carboxyamino)imidazole ribonucleotide synthase